VPSLSIGILGAARITPTALFEPVSHTGDRLVAVAARDTERAEEFAQANGIERVHASYQDVIDDPDVEVIYNPLPNGLHAPWNLRAIGAGKHVLSEKPSASTGAEAKEVRDAVAASDGVFMEAFHYRYHPVMHRMVELAGNGEIGEIEHVEVVMGFPLERPTDPRWSFDLAGGAMMDVGCYALHGLRTLGSVLGGEPTVQSASATPHEQDPRVDAELSADLSFRSGATAHFRSSFLLPEMTFTMHIRGSEGEALAHNFCVAALDNRITVVSGGERRVEHHGDKTTYTYQLEAFGRAVRDGEDIPTDAEDALLQATLIDQCYEAAGLPLRPRSTV